MFAYQVTDRQSKRVKEPGYLVLLWQLRLCLGAPLWLIKIKLLTKTEQESAVFVVPSTKSLILIEMMIGEVPGIAGVSYLSLNPVYFSHRLLLLHSFPPPPIASRLVMVAVIPSERQSVSNTHADKESNVTQMLYSSSPTWLTEKSKQTSSTATFNQTQPD